VRRALSMAIDRERLVSIAMEGYTHPADGSGLSDGYAEWKDPAAAAAPWVRFDRAAAEQLLDEAGWARARGGVRRAADGRSLSLEIQVVSGWSDWVRAAQLIARDLRAVGVNARVRVFEFGSWFANV